MLEINVGGVFVPAMLFWAIIAFALASAIEYLIDLAGGHRFLWHRGLFHVALFVILWAAIAAIPYHLAFSPTGLP